MATRIDRYSRSAPGRRLVLHADDFGMSRAVNRGILEGFSWGLLTSTSILANGPAFAEALRDWKDLVARHERSELPSTGARSRLGDSSQPFDLGVHLNLTQGAPLTGSRFPSRLLDSAGLFPGVGSLFARLLSGGLRFRSALRDELSAQIERVLEHGAVPTHLNGHQYVEMLPVVAGLVPELLARYRIGAVRVAWEPGLTRTTIAHGFQPAQWGLGQVKRLFAFDFLTRIRRCGAAHPDVYFGTVHAGRIDLDLVRRYLQLARPGTTEIGVHPGELPADNDPTAIAAGWADPLAGLRPRELEWIRSRELVGILSNQHIDLGRIAALGAAPITRSADPAGRRRPYGRNRERSSGVGSRQVSFLPNQR